MQILISWRLFWYSNKFPPRRLSRKRKVGIPEDEFLKEAGFFYYIENISKSTATNKPMSGAASPSCTIKLLEKCETANWSLRQGDEVVNKRIKQKIYICPIFRFENKASSGAKRKMKIKLKVRYWPASVHAKRCFRLTDLFLCFGQKYIYETLFFSLSVSRFPSAPKTRLRAPNTCLDYHTTPSGESIATSFQGCFSLALAPPLKLGKSVLGTRLVL